MVLTRAAWSN